MNLLTGDRSVTAFVTIAILTYALSTVPSGAQAVSNITFVAFDFETTGVNARSGRIVEIGAVKFRTGNILARRTWLVNPGIPIPRSAQYVHGITDNMVANAPAITEVWPQFLEFAGRAVLLAHNAPFDIRFAVAEAERNGLPPLRNDVLDTLRLARSWFPGLQGYSLIHLVEHLDIEKGDFHRALADSEYVVSIFLSGIGKLHPDATLADLVSLAGGNPKSK